MSNFRLLQLVVFAGLCLLALKGTALMIGGGEALTGYADLQAQEAPAGEDKKAVKEPEKQPKKEEAAKTPAGAKEKESAAKDQMGPVPKNMNPIKFAEKKILPSNSELDLLESLAVRRRQLNQRETQLKLKENLLQAAQKQVEERIEQLKELEAKIQVDLKKKDVLQKNQYQRLVKIYSSMKAKEAARIFDGLDMPILVDLMGAMKAAASSQIIAKMNPEKARALTLMLARKSQISSNDTLMNKAKDLPEIKSEKPAAKNQ